MKYSLTSVLICCLFCMSCSRTNDVVVASVYDENLTLSDLQEMIPDFDASADSVTIQSYYIEQWTQKQALAHEAERSLTHQEKNFDKQLKDYYQTLLIFAYENKKVEELLDKEVPENEIETYYQAHKSDFEMRKNIVKVNYVKLPLTLNQNQTIRKFLLKENRSSQEQKKMEDLCIKYAENMYLEYDWLLFDDILKEIPINTYNQEQFLQNNRYIELSDTNSVYLVNILDFKINETYSPLSMEKERIKKGILDQRRRTLREQIREEALNKAKQNHEIHIKL